MFSRATQREKNIAQQKKLLNEFPFLWAIRNDWTLGVDNLITVTTVHLTENEELGIPVTLGAPTDLVRIWIVNERDDDKLSIDAVDTTSPTQPGGHVVSTILTLGIDSKTKSLPTINRVCIPGRKPWCVEARTIQGNITTHAVIELANGNLQVIRLKAK